MLLRFVAYGLIGWCVEVMFTACWDAVSGMRRRDDDSSVVKMAVAERLRLTGRTYLWMMPIYGSAALLFEPAHNALRNTAWPVRGLIYTIGIFGVEALTGLVLKRLTGRCPWDYSAAKTNIGGVIRLDYAPVWFVFGLMLERMHDTLRVIEQPLRTALFG